LRDKFYETDSTNGTPGTYIYTKIEHEYWNEYTWIKQ
jgi:hypothetical protein